MKFLIYLFLLAALLILPATAYCELVEGKVMEINPTTNSVGIAFTEPATGREKVPHLVVNSETDYRGGVSNFSQLSIGDPVRVDVVQNGVTKNFEANVIEKSPR
jgi:hypothetical protein